MTDETQGAYFDSPGLEEAAARTLALLAGSYDITEYGPDALPLAALCEYYRREERYFVSRRVNIWSVTGEEFLYVYRFPHLTAEAAREAIRFVTEDGTARANVGPGHMYTYVTALFLCGGCDAEALDAVRRSRHHRYFMFSLRGWLELRAGAIELGGERREAVNRCGKALRKLIAGIRRSKASAA